MLARQSPDIPSVTLVVAPNNFEQLHLAIVLANLCMVFDPQRFVVLDPLRTEFRRRYKLHGLPEAADVRILPASHGEESQVRGAAALVLHEPNETLLARRCEVLGPDVIPSLKAERAWRERHAGAGRRA
jgi:hypothetical protein